MVKLYLCRDLEQEIAHYKEEAIKQRNIIEAMERERNRYVEETADLTQELLCKFEELKVREMQISEYKKTIAEVESELKVNKNIYEKVVKERNDHTKKVIEKQVTVISCASIPESTLGTVCILQYCRARSRSRSGQ